MRVATLFLVLSVVVGGSGDLVEAWESGELIPLRLSFPWFPQVLSHSDGGMGGSSTGIWWLRSGI